MRTLPYKSTIVLLILVLFGSVLSRSSAAPMASFTPPTSVTVRMYRLSANGGSTGSLCSSGDTAYGCTAFCDNFVPPTCSSSPVRPYPHSTDLITVPIETDYLLDVVPREMRPYRHHPLALEGQAVAARTYAYCAIHAWEQKAAGNTTYWGDCLKEINNSNSFQVFVPYYFDTLSSADRQAVQTAVAAVRYLVDANDEERGPIFAEFSADAYLRTVAGDYDYLQSVEDPISYDPAIPDIIAETNAHQRGLSQDGANRWAWGNSSQYSTGTPWSVRWEDYRQILVHYYTGVHIRDTSGTTLAPDYRWNPLRIDWGTANNQPPIMRHGDSYPISVQVQNTGISTWTCDPDTNFALRYRWAKAGGDEVVGSGQASACGTPSGDPSPTLDLIISDVPDWGPGPYMLHFDISAALASDSFWFHERGWFSYTVEVPVFGIVDPNNIRPAYAGPHNNPSKLVVKVTKPEDGLTKSDFAVTIGGTMANIVTVYEGSDEYVLEVIPPTQSADGLYDLTVSATVDTGMVSDSESDAVFYADTNNVDVALVLDRSGSMGDPSSDPRVTKMEAAKNAANMFVDFMVNGDMIGVVSFREYATVNYGLTTIAGTVKTDVQNAIQAISSDGWTSIGDGLQYGQNELTAKGDAAHPWAIVLLSDGLENEPAWVADVLPGIMATKTVVHTIGFGEDADEALMLDIASQTDGTYHFDPSGSPEVLAGIYRTIAGAITGQQTLASFTGTAQQGMTDTHDVIVDSTVSEATFAINWSNSSSDLDLMLGKPNGQVIDPRAAASDPNVDYVSGPAYEYYRVRTPTLVAGVWTMQVTGSFISSVLRASAAEGSGEPYKGLVTGHANLTLHTYLDRSTYLTYEPVRISVSLSDNQSITGASVSVTARQPSGNSTTITLYDDGAHDDGGADDGVYAQTYAGTSTEGTYTFLAQASGTSNTGESFTREEEVSTYIAQSPHPPRQVYLPLILKNYPPDTTPPAAVTNLSTSNPTLDSMTLNWPAPGDDGNTGTAWKYDIRFSTSPITDANWPAAAQCEGEPAPQPAGSSETFTCHGLPTPNTTYYFALKTADEMPNWSGLSNVASGTTLRPSDTTPPATVTNLRTSSPTVDSMTLNWTAPGDDGNTGTAWKYDVRFSTSPITDANWDTAAQCVGEPAPQQAGSSETITVHGLSPNTTHYFALKTADEVPNWSGLSNVVSGTTLRPCDQLIINAGFETDEAWVFGESPRPAAYTTEDAHWGARSVRLGIKPPTTDAYSWSSVRQRITIPANARSATLSFWYKPFSEAPCQSSWQQFNWDDYNVDQPGHIPTDRNPLSWASCDWQQALILTDAWPDPNILATVMNISSNSRVWTNQTFDLMPFAGQTVLVYFNVYNNGWGYGRTWMYLDDVSVEVCH